MKTTATAEVFLASPSDVADEREAVREAVRLADIALGEHTGLHFRAHGWEDVSPGRGVRAQDLINPLVDTADVFIGILAARFGEPTGLAESGTIEEFERAERRWTESKGAPEIGIFFKRLAPERLSDPGPQLLKLLAFQARIRSSTLYREFTDASDLKVQVLTMLVSWAHRRSTPLRVANAPSERHPLATALAGFLPDHLDAPSAALRMNTSTDEAEAAFRWLETAGAATQTDSKWGIAPTAAALIRASDLALAGPNSHSFLGSVGFRQAVDRHIDEVIGTRHHLNLSKVERSAVVSMMQLSPSASAYVLYGDTTTYDNMWDQLNRPGVLERTRIHALGMATHALVQRVALSCASEVVEGGGVDQVCGQDVAIKLISIGVRASTEDHKLLISFEAKMPIMRVQMGGPVRKGEAVFAGPELAVRTGTLLLDIQAFDLAERNFREVLASNIEGEARVASLNNLGVALLGLQRFREAETAFTDALELNPELKQARDNLDRARAGLAELRRASAEAAGG